MTHHSAPIASATRNISTRSVAARLALWLVLAAWGLLAVVLGILHLVIVPRIDDWRPRLEHWASATVGVPVRIDALRAVVGEGPVAFLPALLPSFELHGVRLYDPEGRVALQLPLVRTALSLGSIWRRGFDQVLLEQPVLDVRRNARGGIEVAGLDMGAAGSADGSAGEWFFSQPEFVIRGGTVRWTDDWRGQAPLTLEELDFVARNTARSHQFRLDATPPAEWGERFSWRAQMTEPLLRLGRQTVDAPRWSRWSGAMYADFSRVDVSRLRNHVDLSDWGVAVQTGQGALRAWVDLTNGRVEAVTTDLALIGVRAQLGPSLPELDLTELNGRLAAQWGEERLALVTDDLRFRTREGQVWPGGRLSVEQTRRSARLGAERVDLSALAAVASRLPLGSATHSLLAQLAPVGQVQNLVASWQGEAGTKPGLGGLNWPDWGTGDYQAKGLVAGLGLAAQPGDVAATADKPASPGRPGIAGATVAFDLNRAGGKARLQVQNGALDLPGVFEESRLPLDRFEADASWRIDGQRIEARLDKVRLSNADAEGTGQVSWHTSDPVAGRSRARFPGVLDLSATLTRADATRVHRYLPLTVGAYARDYVRAAVRGGRSGRVEFRVQGELLDMPLEQPGAQGQFRIEAELEGVDLAYVPAYLQTAGETPWPELRGVNGRLVLDRTSLQLTGLSGGLQHAPGMRLSEAEVGIADLVHTSTLVVSARAQGPAAQALGYVRGSPLNGMTGQALSQARMSGPADVQLRLRLPLNDAASTSVKGTVLFAGNDVQISPDSPLLGGATGKLSFSEKGFDVRGARARLYGGEVALDGGLKPDAQGVARLNFRGQGTASADGLRDAGLGFVSRLFQNASGSAPYAAQLGFRAGVPELVVNSGLQGMALNLPAPLGKKAEENWPMRYENSVLSVASRGGEEVALTDRLAVQVGKSQAPLVLNYERDLSGAVPRVLRGSVAWGLGPGEVAPLPVAGVLANVRLESVDVDAWEKAFLAASGGEGRQNTAAATDGNAASNNASLDYLPTTVAIRADRLAVGGRSFHQLVVGGSRQNNLWRANLDAQELNGYVEYRQAAAGSAGSIYARLARLELEPAAAAEVEELLQQPSSVPALDIAVEDFVLSRRRLGRVEIEAVNRGGAAALREWRLTRLNLTMPEARLSASGNWAAVGAQAAAPGAGSGQRRTALNFRLDIDDSGKLLARFGREGVVRNGKGHVEGSIGWLGSPLSLDYASLGGQLKIAVEGGQFLKVEPGAAKLLGVLSLQALPRRLVLDFRDVFSEGFAFDFVRGDASIEQGVARTNNLQMKGVNAAVLMEGSADLAREQQDLQVVVVPEINAGTASLIATAINPAIGLGSFLAQFLLRQPLQSAATQQFHITGGWADPQVEKLERKPAGAGAGKSPALQ